jgi:tRNA G18 (ribose-2'-O)-methylase SpoU
MNDDTRNIIDKYKLFNRWTTEMIKEDLQTNNFPYAVLMEHFVGDFTIGGVLRSGNAFGASKMYYYGGKKSFDRRSTVGTHLYTDIIHLNTEEELLKLKNEYVFVGLENSTENKESIYDFTWPKNSLIILGEEGVGITPNTLALCDKIVYIPQYGSVRSLNASSAASIAMNDYVFKYLKTKL